MEASPFLPGARVAIYVDGGYYGPPRGYREDFVEKSHKTGRFTLRSNPKQQWSPLRPGTYPSYWTARESGDHGWGGGRFLRLWDDTADTEIAAANLVRARYQRFYKLRTDIEHISFSDLVTDQVLDQFEHVVVGIKPIPKEKVA